MFSTHKVAIDQRAPPICCSRFDSCGSLQAEIGQLNHTYNQNKEEERSRRQGPARAWGRRGFRVSFTRCCCCSREDLARYFDADSMPPSRQQSEVEERNAKMLAELASKSEQVGLKLIEANRFAET